MPALLRTPRHCRCWGISVSGIAATKRFWGSGNPPQPAPSPPWGRRVGGCVVCVSPLPLPGRGSVTSGKASILFRPDLDPLPPLLPGSAPGTLGLCPALGILGLLVQVAHQLLDSIRRGRGTDFLVLLGGEHNSMQKTSRLGSLEAVG